MITAIVLTKNEEERIVNCLHGLSWCEEIIVIDDNSTDKTVELAKKHGAKVITKSLNNDFSSQRNYAMERAKNEWVLFIDADEKVTSALWYEIMSHTNNPINEYNGFYIKRIDTMWGKELKHGETGNIKLLRLAKKNSGKWQGKVHEVWKVKGKTTILNNALLHYPHPSVSAFLQEINHYTDLRSVELYKKKVKTYWWAILLYPTVKFILNYILKQGIQDGLQGLLFALMMSFHSFLVRAKLWLLWCKDERK